MPAAITDNTANALKYSVYDPSAYALHAAAVTPNDNNDLAYVASWLWVGGAGTVTVVTYGGETVQYTVSAGTNLRIACTHVKATGTTATGIVAHWM